jgi:hypothetical protein
MKHVENSVRLAIATALILMFLFNIDTSGRMTGIEPQLTYPSISPGSLSATRPHGDEQKRARAREAYGKLPIRFEANAGQTADQVKFLSRASGYNLFLTPKEAVLSLSKSKSESKNGVEPAIRMKFAGANPDPQIEGLGAVSSRTNYLIGNDPSKWRRDVLNYEKIRYHNIYPGTDLVYYGNQQQLEYDFVVAPGADPDVIKLDFDGVSQIRVDKGGDLVLKAGDSEVRQHKAVVYQEADGRRQEIASNYILKEGGEVSFEIGAYDRSRPLVIDPVISYSTFLGARDGDDRAASIVVDDDGSAYVTGRTYSPRFPTANPLQAESGGSADVFVIKLNPEGSDIIFSTYLGGNYYEFSTDIALDAAGNICLTGVTYSEDFPTANAIQPTFGGFQDVFVTKLTSGGSAFIFSTYLGGSNVDYGLSLAVDGSGDIVVSGYTNSTTTPFPTFNAFQPVKAPGTYTYGGGIGGIRITVTALDAFVTKLRGDGSAFVFSTHLGGERHDHGNGLAIDGNGDIYLIGSTASIDFPTANPLQPANGGVNDTFDAYLAKFDSNGAFVYSTYFGGSSSDFGRSISLDGAGNVYLLGDTSSTNFPTASALDSTRSGGTDLFVAKLNPAGSAILYSTYLGGSGDEEEGQLTVDSQGNAYITGYTESTDFPTVNALQTEQSPGGQCRLPSDVIPYTPTDGFVSKLNATGSNLVYSSYLGGLCGDTGEDIAIDGSGNVYLVGSTASANFPITPGAFQTGISPAQNTSDRDGFIIKIAP